MLKLVPIFLAVLIFTGCTTIPQNVTEPVFKVTKEIKEVHEIVEPVFEVVLIQAEKAIETMEDGEKKTELIAKVAKMKEVIKKIGTIVEKMDKIVDVIKAYQELATKEDPPVTP